MSRGKFLTQKESRRERDYGLPRLTIAEFAREVGATPEEITVVLSLLLFLCGSAAAFDVSKSGYAVFWENGSIGVNATRAHCEASRARYLDREAPRLIQSGDIAADMASVPEIRRRLESHLSSCTHVRVAPSPASDANYWVARGEGVWLGATTAANCKAMVKGSGVDCGPVRIDRE